MSDLRPSFLSDRGASAEKTTAAPSGKVVHDSRGNAIWDWAIETGVLATATTTQLLKTLAEPAAFALDLEPRAAPGWSGDPYNRSQPRSRSRSA